MGPKTLELKLLCEKLGRRYVGFRGNPHSPLWFIGEAPGETEDQWGVPFVGSSGKELDRMLMEAGIAQTDCYFTNVYKTRPPDNKIERIGELGIPLELFMEQFHEELLERKPPFLIPLGGTALGALCSDTIERRDGEAKISKWIGSLLNSRRFEWPHICVPNLHPAFILREWADRDVSVFVFRRLKEEYNYFKQEGRHQPLPSRELIVDASVDSTIEFLCDCLKQDGPVSVDIELLARRVPITIGLSYDTARALSLDLFEFEPKKNIVIYRLLDAILRHKWLVGQNFTTFDINWLNSMGFNVNIDAVDDTLVQHHVLYPEMSHKLQFLGMQFTRQPFWKDEGKGWSLREGLTKLRRYNALDSAVTLEVFLSQTKELIESTGTLIGNDLSSIPHGLISVAGFGLEAQLPTDMRSSIMASILHHTSSDYSTNFSSQTLSRIENYITNVKSEDASILGTDSLSQWQSTKPFTKKREGWQEKRIENNFDFYRLYEMPLARHFNRIDKRGILTEPVLLSELRSDISKEQDEKCVAISTNLKGRPVTTSAPKAEKLAKVLNIDPKLVLNIASVPQLKELLKNELKIKLKIDRHTHKETTGEESLNDAFAATGNPVLKDILRIRELNKILGTYVDATLSRSVFYSCYSVTGTVTGRRASRKNFLGFGSNSQNQPKHSDLGERFQGVFVARPDRIFIYCDQASAEEWPVQGIIADVSGDDSGIKALFDSMATGISRHARLAAQLFGLPLEKVNNKECIEYYIGKKTRHAGTYDMRENTMAAQMAAEGFVVETKFCKLFLAKFHEVEPNIRKVYHKYVEHELCTKRFLRTPLGRERVFHGLRPYGDNGKVFREGYAYIPQSTVGDNNGLAILFCETVQPGLVLMDGHDSCLLEVENNWDSVLNGVQLLEKAYDRTMTFPNGFSIKIPIDIKLGYSIKGLKKCPGSANLVGLKNTFETLHQQPSLPSSIISGAPLQQSAQPSKEMYGSTV